MRRRLSWRRSLTDDRGAAAVEFALLFAFFLLPLFIGMIEITTLLRAQQKLSALASDAALMVSIETTSSSNGVSDVAALGTGGTSLQDVCDGAVAGFAPYPADGMTVEIAGVTKEAGANGLPAANSSTSFVYYGSSLYDDWEQDFTVSGGRCSPSGGSGIGAANSINLATSNPPSSAGGGTGGLVQYPCGNAIIVEASVNYPGILGTLLTTRTRLTQWAYQRWRYSSAQSELECTSCTVSNLNSVTLYGSGASAVTQACNSSDTAATN